jgi:hypothetical protein
MEEQLGEYSDNGSVAATAIGHTKLLVAKVTLATPLAGAPVKNEAVVGRTASGTTVHGTLSVDYVPNSLFLTILYDTASTLSCQVGGHVESARVTTGCK